MWSEVCVDVRGVDGCSSVGVMTPPTLGGVLGVMDLVGGTRSFLCMEGSGCYRHSVENEALPM